MSASLASPFWNHTRSFRCLFAPGLALSYWLWSLFHSRCLVSSRTCLLFVVPRRVVPFDRSQHRRCRSGHRLLFRFAVAFVLPSALPFSSLFLVLRLGSPSRRLLSEDTLPGSRPSMLLLLWRFPRLLSAQRNPHVRGPNHRRSVSTFRFPLPVGFRLSFGSTPFRSLSTRPSLFVVSVSLLLWLLPSCLQILLYPRSRPPRNRILWIVGIEDLTGYLELNVPLIV